MPVTSSPSISRAPAPRPSVNVLCWTPATSEKAGTRRIAPIVANDVTGDAYIAWPCGPRNDRPLKYSRRSWPGDSTPDGARSRRASMTPKITEFAPTPSARVQMITAASAGARRNWRSA